MPAWQAAAPGPWLRDRRGPCDALSGPMQASRVAPAGPRSPPGLSWLRSQHPPRGAREPTLRSARSPTCPASGPREQGGPCGALWWAVTVSSRPCPREVSPRPTASCGAPPPGVRHQPTAPQIQVTWSQVSIPLGKRVSGLR